jgi:hypothetical protein
MKKILTFVAAIAFATTAFSQFAVQAGGNVSAFSGSTNDNKIILGYQVGFLHELGDWGDRLSIEPGLFLAHKGGKKGDETYRFNYLQLPINTKLNFYIGEAKLYIGYGIYAACGLGGSKKEGKDKNPVGFGRDREVRMFDVGGQVFVGIVSGQTGASFAYQPGARPVFKNTGIHNTSYMLNFTYYFSDPR